MYIVTYRVYDYFAGCTEDVHREFNSLKEAVLYVEERYEHHNFEDHTESNFNIKHNDEEYHLVSGYGYFTKPFSNEPVFSYDTFKEEA